MNLEYDLKTKSQHEGSLELYADKKKLSLCDFLCFMQYDFFCAFFVSVLFDIHWKDNLVDFKFPNFHSKDLDNAFALQVFFSPQKNAVIEMDSEMHIVERLKYVNIIRQKKKEYIFIPNKSKHIQELKELFLSENKVMTTKMFKIIFDKLFLMIQNEPKKTFSLEYKNKIFIFLIREN